MRHRPSPLRGPLLPLLALMVLPWIGACGGGGSSPSNSGGGDDGSALRGNISALPPVVEVEPNDSVDQLQDLGGLVPGGSVTVLGRISSSADPRDSYVIAVAQRTEVFFSLLFEQTADFQLLLVDPLTDQILQVFNSNSSPEEGSFIANGATVVVVEPVAGSGAYTLAIDAGSPVTTVEEQEPNDTAAEGLFTGESPIGDGLVAAGSLDNLDDPSDFYLLAFPEEALLDIDLGFDTSPQIDFDVHFWETSSGLPDATEIPGTALQSDSQGSETGQVIVDGMSLIAIEVRSFGGSSDYTLGISVLDPPPGNVGQGGGGTARLTAGAGLPEPLATASGLADAPAPYARPRHQNQVAGEVVLRGLDREEVELLLQRRGLEEVERMPDGTLLARFELPAGLDGEEQARHTLARARSLNACSELVFAEPNLWRQPLGVPAGEGGPNDPLYSLQWHYEQIGLPATWDLTTGDTSVIVAVLDTGETPHPDIDLRQINGYDMIADPANAGDGNGRDSDPTDVGDNIDGETPGSSSFHGTHVAGTVGAASNNGKGVAGVTWFTRLMHVRVLGLQGGTSFDIANGVLYAAGQDNASGALPQDEADIINMSLGGPSFSQVTQNAVSTARANGALVIAAAGNNNTGEPFYPAAYDDVISVSAVDFNGDKAPYSNFNPTVDIAAPGGNVAADQNGDGNPDGVLSILYDDSQGAAQPVYGFYQGTSMAAPHVAGVAALMLAVDPLLTPAQLENILTSTAVDRGDPGQDDIYGAGIVNAFAAVQQAQNGAPTDPVLVLGATQVGFDASTEERTVGVQNGGQGLLEVFQLLPSVDSGGNWLSVEAIGAPGSTTSDTAGILIEVDRLGLSPGIYTGAVDVESSGGGATIDITMTVGAAGEADLDIFVLVIDIDSFETVAQRVVNLSSDGDYSFATLPAGTYYVVAGSDVDNDGFICDEGEPYCGFYPSLDLIESLTIEDESTTFSGIDFPVQSLFKNISSAPAGNDSPGFRRL